MRKALTDLEQDTYKVEMETLDAEESRKKLATYISYITRKALTYIREDANTSNKEMLMRQIQLCNQVIDKLNEALPEEDFKELHLEEEGHVLLSIYSTLNNVRRMNKGKAFMPISTIYAISLVTSSYSEPNMLNELKKEILTSNKI